LCYCLAALWFHRPGAAPTPPDSIIDLVVGLAALALWSLVVTAAEAEPGWALAPPVVGIVLVPMGASIYVGPAL
jgi:hypothetical protein